MGCNERIRKTSDTITNKQSAIADNGAHNARVYDIMSASEPEQAKPVQSERRMAIIDAVYDIRKIIL